MIAVNQIKFKNIPISVRVKAWWEGYQVDALQDVKSGRAATAKSLRSSGRPISDGLGADGSGAGGMGGRSNPVTVGALRGDGNPGNERRAEPWSKASVEASQAIWGKGFCGPSNEGYLNELSEQLDIKPNTSILQLGAQLGGQAQELADRYRIKVRGLEASSMLLEIGSQMGEEKRAHPNTRISPYNPESFDGFNSKFEGAFSQEALFSVEGKRDLLAQVESQLRPGGRLSLTEYMLGSNAALEKDIYHNWTKHERRAPYPVLLEEMKDILTDLKLEVHVSEDISPQYNSMVKQAWADVGTLATKLAEKPEGVEKIRAIASEAEIWQAREKITASGDLRMWRIVARKKPALRMLSDW